MSKFRDLNNSRLKRWRPLHDANRMRIDCRFDDFQKWSQKFPVSTFGEYEDEALVAATELFYDFEEGEGGVVRSF